MNTIFGIKIFNKYFGIGLISEMVYTVKETAERDAEELRKNPMVKRVEVFEFIVCAF